MSKQPLQGVYLVIDPAMEQRELLEKIEQALEGGVDILQIWDNWPEGMASYDKEQLITYILELAAPHEVPVLINEAWQWLKQTDLHGVHFDQKPEDIAKIKEEVGRGFIAGITCSNDLETIRWAEEQGFDYASFCAMFPSPSVGSCEIVRPETVKKARDLTDMPLFLSGGIIPGNVNGELSGLDFQGVAVISGILKDDDPAAKVQQYKEALRNTKSVSS